MDDCSSQPCHNEGTCIDSVNIDTCICVDGCTAEKKCGVGMISVDFSKIKAFPIRKHLFSVYNSCYLIIAGMLCLKTFKTDTLNKREDLVLCPDTVNYTH